MRRDLPGAGLLILALATGLAAADPAPAQAPDPSERQVQGRKVDAWIEPGDPRLPKPEELSPETDSRRFVESFLAGMLDQDLDVLFDAYLHSELKENLGREAFKEQVNGLREAVGGLQRLTVVYFREENARYDGADGGWANHVMVTERDPQVNVRVDFRRGGDGLWQVYAYSVRSAQMDRVQAAREAAEKAARPEDETP
jgi:hypothetical protein